MLHLELGDSAKVLLEIPDNSIDAVVCDPPYGLSFMGRAWDYDVPSVDIWREVCRVLKPGGHLVAFFGSRTYHRGTVAIEDAGFEIRDQLMWLYGSGFPKSMDVSKAIDKAAGAEREVIGQYTVGGTAAKGKRRGRAAAVVDEGSAVGCTQILNITAPATEAARQWQGWGTALKPAHEPICLARKPFSGTVAANVLEHGTGAINVDACRVGDSKQVPGSPKTIKASKHTVSLPGYAGGSGHDPNIGRWPANVLHDGSDEVVERFPDNAARFFYSAKVSKGERGEGNTHPTVKPIALMEYLCKLITPPGGLILDPFMGSGSTGLAARAGGFDFIGIERDPAYFSIAKTRLAVD